jgi:hypothetical protein
MERTLVDPKVHRSVEYLVEMMAALKAMTWAVLSAFRLVAGRAARWV